MLDNPSIFNSLTHNHPNTNKAQNNIARGTEAVTDVYVNFLSATTFYLVKLMKDDSFFLQGTGCRILWDVDTERSQFKMSPIEAADFFLARALIALFKP